MRLDIDGAILIEQYQESWFWDQLRLDLPTFVERHRSYRATDHTANSLEGVRRNLGAAKVRFTSACRLSHLV